MIEASVRLNAGWLGQIFFGDLQLSENGNPVTPADLVRRAAGRKVLILVHGYHTPYGGALDSYTLIADEAAKRGIAYDLVIGFFWPGSPLTAGFLPSIDRASKSGYGLLKLIYWLSDWTAIENRSIIDIETHSLGAEVALTAMSDKHARIRNLLLTGPAVPANCFEPGKRFRDSAAHCERVDVFYSRRDEVLGTVMPFGEPWVVEEGGALGFRGLRIPVDGVCNCDLTQEVAEHGGYRRAAGLYEVWRRQAT